MEFDTGLILCANNSSALFETKASGFGSGFGRRKPL